MKTVDRATDLSPQRRPGPGARLCMLAYYVEWHLRSKLAPVLFDDHDRAA